MLNKDFGGSKQKEYNFSNTKSSKSSEKKSHQIISSEEIHKLLVQFWALMNVKELENDVDENKPKIVQVFFVIKIE
jgi:hypothetical protein